LKKRIADKLLGEVPRTYFSFYEKNRKYFRIMFLSSQPDVRERVADELLRECLDSARECMQVLSDVIEKGIGDGVFRKVNPWAFANILWSTVNGIIMHYEQGPLYRDEILRLPLREMLHEALDLALNGLRVSAVQTLIDGTFPFRAQTTKGYVVGVNTAFNMQVLSDHLARDNRSEPG